MKERIFHGLGVSPGIAIGPAYILEMVEPVIWMHRVPADMVDHEVERFRKAIEVSRDALLKIKNRIGKEMGDEHAYIFDAHLLMLDDPMLTEGAIEHIRNDRVNAEFALQQVTNELSRSFESFEDVYLRERSSDVLDVGNRIQWHLCRPTDRPQESPKSPSVLVSHDLHPSQLASMDSSNLLGITMDIGGQTTHTGLLASSKGIPAVVGLHDLSAFVRPGTPVIVDGSEGTVIINPTEETLKRAGQKRQMFIARDKELRATADQDSITTDGVELMLFANVELEEELEQAYSYGAQGVGLYRSEYIFLRNPAVIPTEDDHAEMYGSFARKAAGKPVILRTIDLGGEKGLESLEISSELNPALGLRGVRYGLARKAILKAQISGILRAGIEGDLRMMIPMVSGIGELRQVKKIIEQCMIELTKKDVPFRKDLPIGTMIEVPSAAMIADSLAMECDFLSIGTNDLIQYTLAVDRANEAVSYIYDPFHPAVLRILEMISDKILSVGKPMSMCGEMASDPYATPLLIGLGYRDLSMKPIAIPVIKTVIRELNAAHCREIAREALKLVSARDVHLYLEQTLEHHYPMLKQIKLDFSTGDEF